MKTRRTPAFVNTSARRQNLMTVVLACMVVFMMTAAQAADPLASWNDGPAKQAILEFVKATKTQGSPQFVPPEERIATFDQDGTLWVEHPMYTQVMYCLEKVPGLVKAKPELAKVAPFNTVLELLHGDRAAMEKLTLPDLEKIGMATITDISVETFQAEVKQWLADAKHGKPFLTKAPKLVLNDNYAGKLEGIHLMIGRRPHISFGNSTGDQQMLEYAKAGDGARLSLLVLHDDAEREYAYGPAQGLPDTKVGTFTQALYDEAKKNGWTVISMEKDWKVIFPFENK